ncbi:cyclopropane fatty acyl phospholipid synthase [Gilvimarinus sp. F26214L]|uniref:cyclopropane fatty acyl phospholipid synthase n=1 Tax=Gilvimarinus sp. DZF01 TaxID=3461371 RepID=UPI004045FF3B
MANEMFTTHTTSPPEKHDPPAVLQDLCQRAGITINGNAPWDIQVRDKRVYEQVLLRGSLGFGETYIEGLWDCERLDELFGRLLKLDPARQLPGMARLHLAWGALRQRLINLQSQERAFTVGERHYDAGNDLFEAMLDSRMLYSCAFWANADHLEEAQVQKLDMICRKLELKPGEHLLDIGCGWGGLAQFAAERYGVEVTGVTISKEQETYARLRCAGLPVRIKLMDYRDLDGCFDKVVSVGMFEHVGKKNYTTYFDHVRRLLKDEGLFLLHTIGNRRTVDATDAWIDKYVFPNGKLPSARDIATTVENRFLIEDWHNFGQDYDRTLMAWKHNFDQAWPELRSKYGDKFYRMWSYYLLCCAGFFRSRQGQLWQLVLAKRERECVYRSVR